MVKTMAKLRMAHASTHGARKPPGPKELNSAVALSGYYLVFVGEACLTFIALYKFSREIYVNIANRSHSGWFNLIYRSDLIPGIAILYTQHRHTLYPTYSRNTNPVQLTS